MSLSGPPPPPHQLRYLWWTTSITKILKIGNVDRRICSRPEYGRIICYVCRVGMLCCLLDQRQEGESRPLDQRENYYDVKKTFCTGFGVTQNSEKIWTYSSSRSSKVHDLGTNRKRVYDFLLVGHCDYGPILHRFWDKATYWLKIAYFSYPSLIQRPAPYVPLEFRGEVKRQETRVIGLLCGEGCVILTSTVFDWSTRVTDRRTDGRAIAYSAL